VQLKEKAFTLEINTFVKTTPVGTSLRCCYTPMYVLLHFS